MFTTLRRMPLRLRFTADAGDTGGSGGSTPPAPDSTPPAGAPADPPTPPAGGPADSPWDDPAKAKAEIERLRRENAADRTNAKTAAAADARKSVLEEFGKALGFIKDGDGAPTAEQLTKAAHEAATEARAARVELAAFKAAGKHNADPAALVDSRAFLAKVATIDPAAADFDAQVEAAVKQAVTDNPKLLAASPGGASAVDHAGGSGETGKDKHSPGRERLLAAYTAPQQTT